MPALQELKAKWFIDLSRQGQFPPQTRHPGALLHPWTDGNLVELVLDGAPLMAEFYQRTEAILSASDPSQHELWLAQWKLQPVKLLGETNPAPDAETTILNVAKAGAKVYFLGSGHTGQDRSARTFAKKLMAAGGLGASDRRLPRFASQHQKFYIFRQTGQQSVALLGSADLNYSRWDRPGHAVEDPDRNRLSDGPSHDVSVRVHGPAVHDIALTFAERWNDSPRHTYPAISSAMLTTFLQELVPPVGPHSVQVLRTYGLQPKRGYSWARQGEFTIWAAYLNAIKQASRYIYIEDQYFYSFFNPPAFTELPGRLRDSDVVYQLGEAIRRGVNVVVLVPSRKGSRNPTNVYQLYARRAAADYLRRISESTVGAGRFVIGHLVGGEVDPIVHAKVMIVDDEFALVGSANVCRRSMTCDTEIHLGIVDAENRFGRDLRLALWQEHLDLVNPAAILDPTEAVAVFYEHAANGLGRLCLLDSNPGAPARFHQMAMNTFIDPYRGPPQAYL